ncbi:hypothetical protein CFC21_000047 [Triticum aestivum]|uniref:AAA+ ATPase domain-containing protein n=2 Tax=Triticum TaxID=4564 RepID=A0A9R0PIH5_TRITD|nr:hypothetical protein CFC21_000047 [Triticum aestivum]VAH00105.1 unnamed protein product [Triticum turgidum subsp. durum]
MVSKELWAGVGSALAFLAGLITLAVNQVRIKLFINKITASFSSTVQITIPEYTANRFERNELFVAIEAYISYNCSDRARKLKAELGSDEQKPHLFVDDEQEIIDTFEGTTLCWYAYTEQPRSSVIVQTPGDEERRFYRVAFHRSFRDEVNRSYLPHVLKVGRTVIANNRQRRLFTNNPDGETYWSHVAFQHPATFDTLAMDPMEKQAIINDLNAFRKGKHYYDKVGKAWKRGYLLFGPPGTGKSTMIAAISNHLEYDIYDLELTAVKNNIELRKLFIETKGKSIIVIEDIDCSVDFTGKRGDKKSGGESDNMKKERKQDADGTKLTLSGMLNFIDGLWSACGGERIIIFTTNHKDKLDPALIRPGRMDKHIEMSYCRFEAFKVLANNYLDITISAHHFFELFTEIGKLLQEVDMSPAEVAGYLMRTEEEDADACLKRTEEEDAVACLKRTEDEYADARLKRLVEALKKRQGQRGHG